MVKIFVASGNPDKAKEIVDVAELVWPSVKNKIKIRPPKFAEETADSFLGNARIKAEALDVELLNEGSTDYWVLADDSGLCVSGLNGAPGIHSARFAGIQTRSFDANIEKLISLLKEFSENHDARSAYFHCSLVLLHRKNQDEVKRYEAEGKCFGKIALSPAENKIGFGYDPVFFYPNEGKTFAELSENKKNEISHRRQAFEILKTCVDFKEA